MMRNSTFNATLVAGIIGSRSAFARFARFAAVFALLLRCGADDSDTCQRQSDCGTGFYCLITDAAQEGTCEQDCVTSADCPQPESSAQRAVCSNFGRCRVETRPPRLLVTSPEPDTEFAEGTEQLQVTGVLEMAAARATVVVTTTGNNGCGIGGARQVTVENTEGGYIAVPFTVDGIEVDPGQTDLIVEAVLPGGQPVYPVPITVACPDCGRIVVTAPEPGQRTGQGLRLPFLRGQVNRDIEAAIWRVRGQGGVLDGPLPVDRRIFRADDIPLFPGANKLEVLVTGVGAGRRQTRCSIQVNAGVSVESGLRAILTWDGATTDLDLHLIAPNGAFGDPNTSLSSRSRNPTAFSGEIADDFDGLGPEVLTVRTLPDGSYGLLVESVFDDLAPGSTAFLRVLYDGRTLTSGPIGPRYLKALNADLWVAGVLEVSNGQAAFRSVDAMTTAGRPPVTIPSRWPVLF